MNIIDQHMDLITKAEDARVAASFALDVNSLRELLHPDFIFIHSNALIDTRESYLERLATREITYDRYQCVSLSIPYASAELAIAQSELDLCARFRGNIIEAKALVLTTWIPHEGGLQAVSIQSTTMPS